MNVVINFRTTVELTDEIITAPRAIAHHYVFKSGWFWWDLVSACVLIFVCGRPCARVCEVGEGCATL